MEILDGPGAKWGPTRADCRAVEHEKGGGKRGCRGGVVNREREREMRRGGTSEGDHRKWCWSPM